MQHNLISIGDFRCFCTANNYVTKLWKVYIFSAFYTWTVAGESLIWRFWQRGLRVLEILDVCHVWPHSHGASVREHTSCPGVQSTPEGVKSDSKWKEIKIYESISSILQAAAVALRKPSLHSYSWNQSHECQAFRSSLSQGTCPCRDELR